MDLENIMLSETSQVVKDKYHRFQSYVESNEQTELTKKQTQIRRWQLLGLGESWRVEVWSKKEKGLMDMDNRVVIAGGEGV